MNSKDYHVFDISHYTYIYAGVPSDPYHLIASYWCEQLSHAMGVVFLFSNVRGGCRVYFQMKDQMEEKRYELSQLNAECAAVREQLNADEALRNQLQANLGREQQVIQEQQAALNNALRQLQQKEDALRTSEEQVRQHPSVKLQQD